MLRMDGDKSKREQQGSDGQAHRVQTAKRLLRAERTSSDSFEPPSEQVVRSDATALSVGIITRGFQQQSTTS